MSPLHGIGITLAAAVAVILGCALVSLAERWWR